MAKTPIEKIRTGIEKYEYLRKRLYAVNVSADREYQKTFNGFFRMGRRRETYYTDFFEYLESNKNKGLSFETALKYLYERHGRLEISFVSKMVAIVNPDFPIWDSVVAKGHFGVKAPYANEKNRFEKAVERYQEYCQKYATYMQTEDAKKKIAFFDIHFPGTDISNVKKVDFVLWQER